jgi:hypothetical protein
MLESGTSARIVLDLLKQIRTSIPKMQKIWEVSIIQNRDLALLDVISKEAGLREKLQTGKLSLDSTLVGMDKL